MLKTTHTSKRIFFGLPVDDNHVDLFKSQINSLHPELLPYFNWVRPGNFHITMQFIGNVLPNAIPELVESVEEAVKGTAAFPVSITKIDLFPENHPHMIAGYVLLSKPLADLYNNINNATSLLGYPIESRPYLPHITLSREKSRRSRMVMNPIFLKDCIIKINELILFESQPEEGGSVYMPLHRYKLGE